jgi:hypothetical protein
VAVESSYLKAVLYISKADLVMIHLKYSYHPRVHTSTRTHGYSLVLEYVNHPQTQAAFCSQHWSRCPAMASTRCVLIDDTEWIYPVPIIYDPSLQSSPVGASPIMQMTRTGFGGENSDHPTHHLQHPQENMVENERGELGF